LVVWIRSVIADLGGDGFYNSIGVVVMGDLFTLTNIVVDFMKHFTFYGISLWFILQTFFWTTIVVFPLLKMFLGMFGGSSDD
jgi:hypothetical protein